MENIVGLFAAITIGLSLGLIGGGGSILTVPALVYLMHVEPVLATAYSLFIVGLSSLIGSVNYMKKGLVSYKTAVVFAAPSLTAVFLTRKYIVPAIPQEIITLGDFVLTKDLAIMLFFAVIMVAAALSMIRSGKKKDLEGTEVKFNYPMILLEGAVVGVLTGIVGAGGGFLIIPALVLLAKLPMKMAVGTSLLIIAVKSLIGFLGDVSEQVIDWNFLAIFSGLAIAGILIGSFTSKYVSAGKLKGAFGWFVLVMGAYIIARELMVSL
jgi:uncharacterized membrane protein YfcA